MGEDMSEFLIRELGRQPDRQQDPRPDHAEQGWAADGVRPFKGRPPPASSSLCAFIPHRENARAYACRPCPAMRGLRNLAIALIRRCGWPGIPTGHRHDAAPPGDAQRDRRLTTARYRSQAPRPGPAQRRPAVRRMCALAPPVRGSTLPPPLAVRRRPRVRARSSPLRPAPRCHRCRLCRGPVSGMEATDVAVVVRGLSTASPPAAARAVAPAQEDACLLLTALPRRERRPA